MALTATYNADLSRIQLAAASLSGTATYAVFDRTTNGVTWTTIRGGGEVAVVSTAAAVSDYEFPVGVEITYRVRSYNASDVLQDTMTTTITQTLDVVWIKVVSRPYLNRTVTVTEVGDRARPSRSGVFDVQGRSFPVAVSGTRGSRQFGLQVMTETATDAENFDLLLASGEAIFLHAPAGFPVPSMYASVGDTTEVEPARGDPTRLFDMPLTEIAAPGPDVVGSLGTWTTVLAGYATWTALMAGEPTWGDVLELVGDPSEIVVP